MSGKRLYCYVLHLGSVFSCEVKDPCMAEVAKYIAIYVIVKILITTLV